MGQCCAKLERLIEEEELVFAGLDDALKPSVVPNLSTTRHVLLKALGNFFGLLKFNFEDTVELVDFIIYMNKKLKGLPMDANTYLAMQNAVIAFTTPKQKSYKKALEEFENPSEVSNGSKVIYGYGKAFPSDEVVGGLYSVTMLSWMLNYEEASGQYVLNHTTDNNSNPVMSKLVGTLNDKKYHKTKMYFDAEEVDATHKSDNGKELKLKPVKVEVWSNGKVTQTVVPGDNDWQTMVTATVTISFFVYEVLHASLHLMTTAGVTAFMLTVPRFLTDIFPLIKVISKNVYLKQEEVFLLLIGSKNKFLTGNPFDANAEVVREAVYEFLTMFTGTATLDDDSLGSFMNALIYPRDIPDAHKQYFCPGVAEEFTAAVNYSNAVNAAFEGDKDKPHFDANIKKNLKKIGTNGFMDKLDNLGRLLLCISLAGGVLHSQTMLTKIGFTPLVSPFNTKTKSQTFDAKYGNFVQSLIRTINEFDYDEEFGDYEIEEGNRFHAAAKEFSDVATKIRRDMSEKYAGCENPVQPFYYFEGESAKDLGYSNTATTYV